MKILTILFFVCFPMIALAGISLVFPHDLTEWKAYRFRDDETFWSMVNHSDYEWVVQNTGGTVLVSERTYETTHILAEVQEDAVKQQIEQRFTTIPWAHQVFEVYDGYFVTNNKGEWGGELWFYPKADLPAYKVSDDQVYRILVTHEKILGIEGLAHLGISEGHVIELVQDTHQTWYSRPYQPLPEAPILMIQNDEDSVYILTSSKLLCLYLQERHLEEIVHNLPFWQTYPNSMIQDTEKNIYIGMRHVIVKISGIDQKKKLTILVPHHQFMEIPKNTR